MCLSGKACSANHKVKRSKKKEFANQGIESTIKMKNLFMESKGQKDVVELNLKLAFRNLISQFSIK